MSSNNLAFEPTGIASGSATEIALPWIIRLRYCMAIGQAAAAIFVQYGLSIRIPLGWIAIGPVVAAITNYCLARMTQPSNNGRPVSLLVGMSFVLDTLLLTYLLMLSGGAANPFSLLYLVHITLSATLLSKYWTWALGALSTLCFGLLFRFYEPISVLEMGHHGTGGGELHLIGMWIGFGLAASLVALFSGKISELLRRHENSLLLMRDELAKRDRLASLATLAAGAAHELNTPLGTIAVVARELEIFATKASPNQAVAEDSRLIRSEVDRCQEILWRMSAHGAQPAANTMESVVVQDLLLDVLSELHEPDRLEIAALDEPVLLRIPRRAVSQALIALTKNALEASASGQRVKLVVQTGSTSVSFVVIDEGKGMSEEALRRVCEPFFTTKEPGKGMGLGTFLVRSLAEQLSGHLRFESGQQVGTRVTFELPLERNQLVKHAG